MLRSILPVTLALAVALAPRLSASSASADPGLTRLLLAADWDAVARQAPLTDPVSRVLRGHALLATNQSDAYCLLNNDADTAAWVDFSIRFAKGHPQSPVALYFLGDARARQGDYFAALAAYGDAIARDPRFAAALNARGLVHALGGNVNAALMDLAAAERHAPRMVDATVNRAFLKLYRREDMDMAIKLFDKALTTAPAHILARAGRAYALIIRHRPEAEAELKVLQGDADSCVAQTVAKDLVELSKWSQKRAAVQVRASDAGMFVTRMFNQIGSGDKAAIHSAVNGLADYLRRDPASAPRVSAGLNQITKRSPELAQLIGGAINRGVKDTAPASPASQLLAVASTLWLKGGNPVVQLGVNSSGIAKIQQREVAASHQAFSTLQGGVAAARQQNGGVQTGVNEEHIDRGDYPDVAHFTLGYRPRAAGSR